MINFSLSFEESREFLANRRRDLLTGLILKTVFDVAQTHEDAKTNTKNFNDRTGIVHLETSFTPRTSPVRFFRVSVQSPQTSLRKKEKLHSYMGFSEEEIDCRRVGITSPSPFHESKQG